MSLNNKKPKAFKILDIIQIVFALCMTIAYLYFITCTDYLDSWYLKIVVGIASIGALIGGILHWKKSNK